MWAYQVKKVAYVGTLSENPCFDGLDYMIQTIPCPYFNVILAH